MPRAKFKPLTLGSLPRVLVAILAMPEEAHSMIAETIAEDIVLTANLRAEFQVNPAKFGVPNADNLANLFDSILQLSKKTRIDFVRQFDKLLTRLQQQDAFGTEGQHDPRGSHRD
jgi:hypothetical protein